MLRECVRAVTLCARRVENAPKILCRGTGERASYSYSAVCIAQQPRKYRSQRWGSVLCSSLRDNTKSRSASCVHPFWLKFRVFRTKKKKSNLMSFSNDGKKRVVRAAAPVVVGAPIHTHTFPLLHTRAQ